MTHGVERTTARVVLVDAEGRTLLLCGGDPSRPEGGQWWFTPGGGIEQGETVQDAARREVLEETGIAISDLVKSFYTNVSSTTLRVRLSGRTSSSSWCRCPASTRTR